MKKSIAIILLGVGGVLPLFAANGVTDTEITIGSSLPLEGGFSAVGQQTKLGVEACFRAVNDAGGVNGRKLKLVAYNDGYEPVPCVQNTLKLIDTDKVFALCSYVGTPTSVKAMKVWQSKQVPVVGFYTGAGALRNPFNPYNIHVRASYAKEADAIVNAFVKEAGASKIAIFYQNDAFGEAVKSVTEAALTKANLKAVALGNFERNTLDVEKGLADIKAAAPDAIVMVGTYAPLAKFVKAAKAAGLNQDVVPHGFLRRTGSVCEGTWRRERQRVRDASHAAVHRRILQARSGVYRGAESFRAGSHADLPGF
jgi:branched-chain amino acid transport system substrate-binding protein